MIFFTKNSNLFSDVKNGQAKNLSVIFLLYYIAEQTVEQCADNKTCDQNAEGDDRERFFHSYIHNIGNKSACPAACSGQRNGNEQEKSPRSVFLDGVPMLLCLAFKLANNFTEMLCSFHQFENLTQKKKNERDRKHISDIAYHKRPYYIHIQKLCGYQAAPEFKNREQGNNENRQFIRYFVLEKGRIRRR